MNEDHPRNSSIGEQSKQISVKKDDILSLPSEKAISQILESPDPKALVQSLQAEDVYYLLNDIGPEDALPVLKMASDEQWEFVLDLEVWEKNQIKLPSVTRWLNLLITADSRRAVKWLVENKKELLELFFLRNIEFKVREFDQDPSEMGEEFFTLDDAYYIRILDAPPDPEIPNEKNEEENDEKIDEAAKERIKFIKGLIDKLADFDHVTYQNLLLESHGMIPAETEEEAYRNRNIRLAEKGFLPFEEAVGVYQALSTEEFYKTDNKFVAKETDDHHILPVPVIHNDMLEGDNLFTSALRNIGSAVVLQQLQSEFAGLCNQIIVADQNRITSKNGLKPVVQKVSGYLHLGLLELSSEKDDQTLKCSIRLIQDYPLSQIFRVGYGLAVSLKWRAEAWRKQSWFEGQNLPLNFWGEAWLGVLGGLLIKKPLYFDNYRSGLLYREFSDKPDIDETAEVLEEIIAFDHLLSLMGLDVVSRPERFLTYKSLILTLWARNVSALSDELDAIPLKDFKAFYEIIFEPLEKDKANTFRRARTPMKEDFLKWLSTRSGLDRVELSHRLGKTLEHLFLEVEEEYGSVSLEDLDSRYIQHFLVSARL